MLWKLITSLLLLSGVANAQVVDLKGDSLPVLNDQLRRLDTMLNTGDTECIVLKDIDNDGSLNGNDDYLSAYRAKGVDWTITSIWCETDQGTVNVDLQVDDGTPADVHGTDLACISTDSVEVTSLNGDTALEDGDRLDVVISSVSGNPKRAVVCWTGTKKE